MKYLGRVVLVLAAFAVPTMWVHPALGGSQVAHHAAPIVHVLHAEAKPKPKKASAGPPKPLTTKTWILVPNQTSARWPATGAYSLVQLKSGIQLKQLAGWIGLNPDAPRSEGTAILRWWYDRAGTEPAGVLGLTLSSLIVSNDLPNVPNQGPYLTVEFKCFRGDCPIGFRLFGTNTVSNLWEIPADTMLYTEKNHLLAAHTPETLYPDDYFAGEVYVHFNAPSGVIIIPWGADLIFSWYELTHPIEPGDTTITVPFGTWMMVIVNTTDKDITFDLTVTPNLNQKTVPVPMSPATWDERDN